jgi:hypothetical protein
VFELGEGTVNESGTVMKRNTIICAVSLVLAVLLSTVPVEELKQLGKTNIRMNE